MKVKDLISQLSNHNPDANVEIMYSFYTLSSEDEPINVLQIENDFMVLRQHGATDPVLLATSKSLE